jgi:hypothetical protein
MIRWDEDKDAWLVHERGVSFQEIADIIPHGDYLDILEHPGRPNQYIFVLRLHDYVWVVPFTIDDEETIFLKTTFPSRKFNKRYGGIHERNQT